MTRLIRISEPASDELSEAVRWYEVRRPGLGEDFFNAVNATLGLVETSPEIGATVSADGNTRRMLVVRFPYQVVYRLRPTELVVVAVAHMKRRPRYWTNRS